jgi:hypothetical protein
LKLEVSDDLVKCPCCDSLLRLARWEPTAFEVVRWGNVLETPAEKEDRIRYEEEMAKLTYREPDSGRTRVSEIDISAPSRALRFIRLVDYLLVIICGLSLVQTIAFHVHVSEFSNGPGLAVYLVIETVLLLGVCAGYRHVGVIDERAWGNYLIILPLLLLIFILELIVLFLITTGAIGRPAGELHLGPPVYDLLYLYVYGLLAVAGLVSVLRLRRMRLLPFDLPLVGLPSELRSRSEPLPRRSKSARRLNAPLGVFLAAVGIVIILACALFPPLVMNRSDAMTSIVFSFPQVPGWILLMRSRRYFQVDADSLLSVDKRRPILFLRPFSDDQKLKFLTLPINLLKSLLDFSLEVRLSNHFTRFGPFIAVGVPGETAPVRGAARVVLAHQEWLPKVSDWMKEAGVIVMYAGSTNWVSWELAKIIETGSVLKLILIIPEVTGEARAVRAENVSLRIERLSRVLKDTRWSNSFAELRSAEDVRAMLLRDDGSIVVVRSQPHNRDSHHLAALIAHYIMLNQNWTLFN